MNYPSMNYPSLSLSIDESRQTAAYLEEAARRFPCASAAVQSLFGRCCLASAHSLEMSGLRTEAAELAGRILNHPDAEHLELDPLLVIEIHRMLGRAADAEAPALRELLGKVAASLAGQPLEIQQAGRVRNMARQLAAAGFPIRPVKASGEIQRMMNSPDRWFGRPVEQLMEISHHLTAEGREIGDTPSRILSLLALAELRNYRVDLGCALLRVVYELGHPGAESAEAFNFISLQRRRDGRYGYPNQFTAESGPQGDPHLSVFFPLTINAAWLFRIHADHCQKSLAAAAIA